MVTVESALLEDIKKRVADAFGVPVGELEKRQRSGATARARRLCVYLMRVETGATQVVIGEALGGVKPSAVSQLFTVCAAALLADPVLKADLERVQGGVGTEPPVRVAGDHLVIRQGGMVLGVPYEVDYLGVTLVAVRSARGVDLYQKEG